MKTIQEQISVMQAYDDGKEIQCKVSNTTDKWADCLNPNWNWYMCDYRVKPEYPKKKIVPYESAEEFLAAQKEHGMYVKIKGTTIIYLPIDVSNVAILTIKNVYSYKELVQNNWIFLDGTPCGKEVEV